MSFGLAARHAVTGLLLAAACLLTACASTYREGKRTVYAVPADIMNAYHDAPQCCASIADFHFTTLDMTSSIDAKLDSSSPAFTFPTGKSYFLAFKLPVTSESYAVEVYSHEYLYYRTYMFHPFIIILDDQYKVVRSVGAEGFKYSGPRWTGFPHISGQITFPATSGAQIERYLLILTTDELMERGGLRLAGWLEPTKPYEMEVADLIRFGPITPNGISVKVVRR